MIRIMVLARPDADIDQEPTDDANLIDDIATWIRTAP